MSIEELFAATFEKEYEALLAQIQTSFGYDPVEAALSFDDWLLSFYDNRPR